MTIPNLADLLNGPYDPTMQKHAAETWRLPNIHRLDDLSINQLNALDDDAYVVWDGGTKGAVAHYWQPNPHKASGAKAALAAHGNSARLYHTGLGKASIGGFVSLFAEIDHVPKLEQARRWNELFSESGLAPSLVVVSGDTRESAIEALEVDPHHVKGGKSLHPYIALDKVYPATTSNVEKWEHATKLLIVAAGSDTKVCDTARLMRMPGKIAVHWLGPLKHNGKEIHGQWETVQRPDKRLQTVLYAAAEPRRFTLDEIVYLLTEYLRTKFGLEGQQGIDAAYRTLQQCEKVRLATKKKDVPAAILALCEQVWEKRKATPEEAQQLSLVAPSSSRAAHIPGTSRKKASSTNDSDWRIRNWLPLLEAAGIYRGTKGNWHQVQCPWSHLHNSETLAKVAGGFKCHNSNHCHSTGDFVRWLEALVGAETMAKYARHRRPVEPVVELPKDQLDSIVEARLTTTYATEQLVQGKYLPHESLRRRVTALATDKGTGKTELLTFLRRGKGRVVGTSPRRSLCRAMAERLDLPYYEEIATNIVGDASICLDSLWRAKEWSFEGGQVVDKPVSLFIVDEARQQLESIFGGQMDAYKSVQAYNAFARALQRSERVVLADADLDSGTINILARMGNWKPEDIEVRDTVQTPWGYEYAATGKRAAQDRELVNAWRRGEKVAVAMFADTDAMRLGRLLEKTGPDKKVLVLTSKTIPGLGVDLKNINEWIARFDAIVYSPSCGTGISIDVEHFDSVWGYAYRNVGTARDLSQALHRVRKPKSKRISLYIQRGSTDPELDWRKELEARVSVAKKTQERVVKMGATKLLLNEVTGEPLQKEHAEDYCKILCDRRRWGADGGDLWQAWLDYCDLKGYQTSEWEEDPSEVIEATKAVALAKGKEDTLKAIAKAKPKVKEAKVAAKTAKQEKQEKQKALDAVKGAWGEVAKLSKEAKAEVQAEYAEAVSSAKDVPYSEIKDSIPKNAAEVYEQEKAKLTHRYEIPVTPDLVTLDENGKHWARLKHLAHAALYQAGLVDPLHALDAWDIGGGALSHVHNYFARAKAEGGLLKLYGIDLASMLTDLLDPSRPDIWLVLGKEQEKSGRMASEAAVVHFSDATLALAAAVADRVRDGLGALKVSVPLDAVKRPRYLLTTHLGALGLEAVTTRDGSGDRAYRSHLDLEEVRRTLALAVPYIRRTLATEMPTVAETTYTRPAEVDIGAALDALVKETPAPLFDLTTPEGAKAFGERLQALAHALAGERGRPLASRLTVDEDGDVTMHYDLGCDDEAIWLRAIEALKG